MTKLPTPKPRRQGDTVSDFDESDPLFARALSLEFEKKRAKKLLKDRKASGDEKVKLSDVQFELARD